MLKLTLSTDTHKASTYHECLRCVGSVTVFELFENCIGYRSMPLPFSQAAHLSILADSVMVSATVQMMKVRRVILHLVAVAMISQVAMPGPEQLK